MLPEKTGLAMLLLAFRKLDTTKQSFYKNVKWMIIEQVVTRNRQNQTKKFFTDVLNILKKF